MAEDLGTASLELEADQSKLKRDLAAAKSTTAKSGQQIGGEFKKGLDKAAIGSAIVIGAVAVGAKKAIGVASDLNEAQSAVNTTFGKSSHIVNDFASSTEDSFSKIEALSGAKSFAVFGQTAGLNGEQLALFSTHLVAAAQDMASFHNADPSQVLDDIRSGLAGETEPLRKYGILLNEASLNQYAWTNGIAKHGKALTEEQKVLARQGFILTHLGAAQGDYERTASSAANTERRNAANLEDTAASIGQGLLPAYQTLLGVVGATTGVMSEHTTAVKIVTAVLLALATGIIALTVAVKLYTFFTNAATVATIRWTIALLANPIFLITVAIIALVAAIVILWKRSETFRNIILGVWASIRSAALAFAGFFTKTLPAAFNRVLNWVKSNWPKIAVFLSGPFAPLVLLATDAFGIRSKLLGALSDLLNGAKQKAKDIGSGIKDGITGALSGLGSAVAGIVRGAINAIITLIRNFGFTFGGFDPPGPGSIPGFSVHPFSNIPYLDRGGIIPGPIGVHRLAWVAGGETVLPTHRGAPAGGGKVLVIDGGPDFVSYVRRVLGDYSLANGGQEAF